MGIKNTEPTQMLKKEKNTSFCLTPFQMMKR